MSGQTRQLPVRDLQSMLSAGEAVGLYDGTSEESSPGSPLSCKVRL